VSNQGPASTSLHEESGHRASESANDERLKHEVFRRTLLLASAAHELKTPLAVIAGYADFLLADHAGPLNEKQRNILTEMQQSTLRLQTLIEGFLKFSALESGKVEIRKELRDVNKCVEEVIAQWEIPYTARGTTIEFFPDPSLDPIWIDSIKLQNILSNLLDNALKFSPPFGRVTVVTSVDCWERRTSKNENKIHLERRVAAGEARPTVSESMSPTMAAESRLNITPQYLKNFGRSIRSPGHRESGWAWPLPANWQKRRAARSW
jgi:light-regulated signal transduction histidine kinase (bacteriophytochrome)